MTPDLVTNGLKIHKNELRLCLKVYSRAAYFADDEQLFAFSLYFKYFSPLQQTCLMSISERLFAVAEIRDYLLVNILQANSALLSIFVCIYFLFNEEGHIYY